MMVGSQAHGTTFGRAVGTLDSCGKRRMLTLGQMSLKGVGADWSFAGKMIAELFWIRQLEDLARVSHQVLYHTQYPKYKSKCIMRLVYHKRNG
jgi:hypothetical protein